MHFDEQAATWDNDPKKKERAQVFANQIANYIQPNNKLTALEFGCGTGLLSFNLKDHFKSITLADNSKGMIQVLKEKIDKVGISNFKPLLIDFISEDFHIPQHDVIYTLMTFHHIADSNKILKTFSSILPIGGYLCIADLVKEDGSFHAHINDFDGLNGFDEKELNNMLLENGFEPVFHQICFTIEKTVGDEIKQFPLFLSISKKVND